MMRRYLALALSWTGWGMSSPLNTNNEITEITGELADSGMSGDWLRETDNMLQYRLTVSGWTGAKLPVFTTSSLLQAHLLAYSHSHSSHLIRSLAQISDLIHLLYLYFLSMQSYRGEGWVVNWPLPPPSDELRLWALSLSLSQHHDRPDCRTHDEWESSLRSWWWPWPCFCQSDFVSRLCYQC